MAGPVATRQAGPTPPDGGWGWAVVFASFMIHIFTDGMTYSFGVFFVEFLNYFGEGRGYTAWIVSILVGVTLGSGPISSSFVNRYGCRAVSIAGALLSGGCVIVSAFAPNVLTLIFTIGIGTGLGFGLIYLPAIVSVTVYFERYRSLATGIAVCGSGFGTFLFAPLTDKLITEYGWRGAMLIIGGLVLNCVAFGAMFRPLEAEPQQSDAAVPMLAPPTIKKERSRSIEHMNGQGDACRLTLSQPALNGSEESKIRPRTSSLRNYGSGLMLRPDVLYTGSVQSLSSKLRGTTPAPYETKADDVEPPAAWSCSWLPCAAESKAAIAEMLDLALFRDPIFILFAISNFLTSIGFYIPYVYIAAQAETLGLSKAEGSYCLSVIGIANSVGRLILGYISDKPYVNRLAIYNMSLTLCGVATMLSVVCTGFLSLAAYAAVFGFTIGAYVGLTSVVLVDLLGLERLTNAFGLLLLFQGIASLIGPPLGGLLYDSLGTYAPGFYVAGSTIAMSGLILFAIPPIQRRMDKTSFQDEIHLDNI